MDRSRVSIGSIRFLFGKDFFIYFETIPSGAKMGCLLLYSNSAGVW
jgi:hypothetical protein